jgi:hypothetical protein
MRPIRQPTAGELADLLHSAARPVLVPLGRIIGWAAWLFFAAIVLGWMIGRVTAS